MKKRRDKSNATAPRKPVVQEKNQSFDNNQAVETADYQITGEVTGLTKEQAHILANLFVQTKNSIAPRGRINGAVGRKDCAEKQVSSLAPDPLNRRFINKKSVCVVLLIFWMPVIFCCIPGNMMWDTGSSIAQFLKIDYLTPNNPYFVTFLYGSVGYLGKMLGNINIAIMVYCLLQSAFAIFIFADCIVEIGSRCSVAGFILLILYGLVPVFPIYSMSMGKDSSFAVAMLMYTSLTIRAVRQTEFWKNEHNVLMLSLSILLMALFRNQAGWIPSIALILFVVFVLKQKTIIIKSIAILLLVGFFSLLLPSVLRIPRTESRESMSIPLQTMAYYAISHPDDMTDEDKAIISQVIDYDTMITKYNPDISDGIKNIANFNKDTTGAFIKLWLRKLFKNPRTMAEGFYRSVHVYLGFNINSEVKKALGLSNNNPNRATLSDYVNEWLNTPVIELFVKIGMYSILLGVILLLIAIFRQGRYMLCVAPLLMVFVACLFSPVNGYYRYAYAMIVCVPIVLADMLAEIRWQSKNGSLKLFYQIR